MCFEDNEPVASTTPEEASQDQGVKLVPYKFTPEADTWNGEYEFGGPLGALALMVWSHCVLFYFFVCVDRYNGELIYPGHDLLKGQGFFDAIFSHLAERASPTVGAFAMYLGFLAVEWLLAVVMPGPIAHGKAIPSEGGYRNVYRCNAVYAWYCVLLLVLGLHVSGIWPLSTLSYQWGHFLTAAVIVADVVCVSVYLWGLLKPRAIRMSGNPIYDFFMGSCLNPKLPGGVDLKLFAELRNSWVLLFLLTTSCAVRMYDEHGAVTPNILILVLAHLLYTNSCQKGEECVVTTWDISYEKFGWMLIFWNFAGVPFMYCMQAQYLANVRPHYAFSAPVTAIVVLVLLAAYFVFDTVNAQKNRFRMMRDGAPESLIRRKTFPQLPFAFIENPRTLKSERGELFVDGWYRYARKMHYTADIVMASIWCGVCGFQNFLPFFYICFFVGMLLHRVIRDEHRGKEKYGPLWDQYIKLVPARFIPGVW